MVKCLQKHTLFHISSYKMCLLKLVKPVSYLIFYICLLLSVIQIDSIIYLFYLEGVEAIDDAMMVYISVTRVKELIDEVLKPVIKEAKKENLFFLDGIILAELVKWDHLNLFRKPI